MTTGRKTGGKNFPKGVSGNPAGRPPLPEDLKTVKSLTVTEFRARATRFLEMSGSELDEIADDRSKPNLDRMLAMVIRKAVEYGDQARLNFLLDRMIGKVPDKLESENIVLFEQLSKLREIPDEQLEHLAREALQAVKGAVKGKK